MVCTTIIKRVLRLQERELSSLNQEVFEEPGHLMERMIGTLAQHYITIAVTTFMYLK